METPTQLDQAFFDYVSTKLANSTPEEVAHWYITNMVFHNGDYLQYLTRSYKLPSDVLKLHTEIVKLANR